MSDEKLTIEELSPGDYEKEDYKIKIIVVGDSGVGKTNLVNRFTSNKFDTNSKSTIGVEFVYKTLKINKDVIKVEVWDTAGQERYRAITSSYYKGARGAIIVYDITSEESFKNVENWMNDVSKKGNKDVKFLLLGNKKDLINDRVDQHHFFPPRNQHHQKYHQLLLLLLRSILIWLLNSPLKRKI